MIPDISIHMSFSVCCASHICPHTTQQSSVCFPHVSAIINQCPYSIPCSCIADLWLFGCDFLQFTQGVFDIIAQNDTVSGVDHIFEFGDIVLFDDTNPREKFVADYYKENGVIPSTGEEIVLGDFNDDFNNDFNT